MDMPVESLTRPVLARYRADLAKDGRYSTTTKNQTLRFIRGVLKYASDIYGLPDHSRILASLKETDEEAMEEFEVWTPEEFSQFVAAVENPLYALYFTFIYWTGCRRGEAIAIQKDQIGDHTATFKYSQINLKDGLKPTKTRTMRTIKLDDQLFDQLQPLLKEPGKYLFGGDTGLSPSIIRDNFRKAIKISGVKPIRLHDLRHSHASWLIANGVNVVAVSKRLGHKDIATTLRVYTHLLESSDNEMMEKINRYKSK
jgi:integrase